MIGNSNDEINFLHELLPTNIQVPRLRKSVANLLCIKLSKTQLSKIGQSGGFLGRFLGPLLKIIENILKPLAKGILVPLGLTAGASATDAAIQKKLLGFGMTALMILNEKMDDIIKIVKSLKDTGLLVKGVSETNKNEAKEEKGAFFSMLLGTLAASLLENSLTGKGLKWSKFPNTPGRICTESRLRHD